MGRSSVVSGYPISMSFHRLTVDQRTSRFWGFKCASDHSWDGDLIMDIFNMRD